jgi:short subunit dehydrogenase-like uncharacterized protein
MLTSAKWMLYGASGTTGRLIADEAVRRGHFPVLAGRDAAKLQQLQHITGLEAAHLPLEQGRNCARRCPACSVCCSPPAFTR